MSSVTYKSSGVDLEQYEDAMQRLPPLMQRTFTPRVMPVADAFAGLFRLNSSIGPFRQQYDDPVLVSGTDGVGTKLKVGPTGSAISHGRHRPGGDVGQRLPVPRRASRCCSSTISPWARTTPS